MSVDEFLHRETEHFLKRLAANQAHKWGKPYFQTCRYVRARLTSLCHHKGIQFVLKMFKGEVDLVFDDGTPLYSIS